MKHVALLCTLLALSVVAPATEAQPLKFETGFSGELLAISPNGGVGKFYVSPELSMKFDKGGLTLSSFSFIEAGKGIANFQNNLVTASHARVPLFFLTAEGGLKDEKRVTFLIGAVGARLADLPGFDKVFEGLGVSRRWRLNGNATRNEWMIVWDTREVQVGLANFGATGFYRIRTGGRGDYGQMGLTARLPSSRLRLLVEMEFDNIGGRRVRTPRYGLMYKP